VNIQLDVTAVFSKDYKTDTRWYWSANQWHILSWRACFWLISYCQSCVRPLVSYVSSAKRSLSHRACELAILLELDYSLLRLYADVQTVQIWNLFTDQKHWGM